MSKLNPSARVVVMLEKPSDRRTFDLFHWLKAEHPEWSFSLNATRLTAIEQLLYPDACCFSANSFLEIKNHLELHPETQFVYLPFFEDRSIEVASSKTSWPTNLHVSLPSATSLTIASDKEKLAHHFKGQHWVVDAYTVEELVDHFPDSGIVIKPKEGRGAIGVKYIADKKDFVPVAHATYQKRLDGRNNVIGAFYLCKNGEILSHYQHQRIRSYPASGGVSVHAKLVHHPEIEEKGRKILEALQWNGIAMLEFLPDVETGNYYAIECNPRVWGTALLGEYAGARIIENYILSALQLPTLKSNINNQAEIIWLLPYHLLFMIFHPFQWWKSRSQSRFICWLNANRTGTLRAMVFFLYQLFKKEKWIILFKKIKTGN
jgi:hypothetical protein